MNNLEKLATQDTQYEEKHNTICFWHQYTQTNTNNVNKNMVVLGLNNIIKLQVDWHPVFWGLSLQFIFALITLETRWGYDAFQWAGDRVAEFLRYTDDSSSFVFGKMFVYEFAFKVSANNTV